MVKELLLIQFQQGETSRKLWFSALSCLLYFMTDAGVIETEKYVQQKTRGNTRPPCCHHPCILLAHIPSPSISLLVSKWFYDRPESVPLDLEKEEWIFFALNRYLNAAWACQIMAVTCLRTWLWTIARFLVLKASAKNATFSFDLGLALWDEDASRPRSDSLIR